ncbi:MAG: SDR family NAD(P)-dependent oxidoreductase [Rubrivivax sp.]
MILEGKVAIVTGSGRGIGRSIALKMAQEGAKVVINRGRADEVVEEIRAAGGIAVSNMDSVAEMDSASRIVQTALDRFGRLDIVVNNAGNLRDRLLPDMSEEDWDEVMAVHLKGSFCMTKLAAALFCDQRSGRIINTSSPSGLVGNRGQANYGAAKTGIAAFTRAVALELAPYNVTCNALLPRARTQMQGGNPASADLPEPDELAPFAAYLASDYAASVTGQALRVVGGLVAVYSYPQPLRVLEKCTSWTVEELVQLFPQTLGVEPRIGAPAARAQQATPPGE